MIHIFHKRGAWIRTHVWHAESPTIPSAIREVRDCMICGNRQIRYRKVNRDDLAAITAKEPT